MYSYAGSYFFTFYLALYCPKCECLRSRNDFGHTVRPKGDHLLPFLAGSGYRQNSPLLADKKKVLVH